MDVGNSGETALGMASNWFVYDHSAGKVRIGVTSAGHFFYGDTQPTLSSCTGGTLSADANDNSGTVSGITGTTCSVGFASAYGTAVHVFLQGVGSTFTLTSQNTTSFTVGGTGTFNYYVTGK